MFKMATNHDQGDTGTREYNSAMMLLKIEHPGELFKQEMLEVEAQVEIPGYLLSGLEARLYDATGNKQRLRPKLMTRIHLKTQLWPADVFGKRTFSPYHQIVFNEIIPNEMRITDIVTVLRNSKFEVERRWADPGNDQNPNAQRWLLTARRSQGPDVLNLLIAVDGAQRRIDIEELAADTKKITETAQSGQIRLSVLGTLPRDHQELTREMNALQQALRDRYRYQQSAGR